MIVNHITIELLTAGDITHVTVLCPYTSIFKKCKLISFVKIKNDYILKLKVGKDWLSGHKYIFRSFEEVV